MVECYQTVVGNFSQRLILELFLMFVLSHKATPCSTSTGYLCPN